MALPTFYLVGLEPKASAAAVQAAQQAFPGATTHVVGTLDAALAAAGAGNGAVLVAPDATSASMAPARTALDAHELPLCAVVSAAAGESELLAANFRLAAAE